MKDNITALSWEAFCLVQSSHVIVVNKWYYAEKASLKSNAHLIFESLYLAVVITWTTALI